MNSFLTDILLPHPYPSGWLRFLMFATFTVHLFWVLIMLGSAMIALYYHWIKHRTEETPIELWDHHMHQYFVIPKSIAVVLGVGALLVTQLYYALPFYTSYVFFAPWWLCSFAAMIVAFILLEIANHRYYQYGVWALVVDIAGVLVLLAIPAIFVTVLVSTEYTELWSSFVASGFRITNPVVIHWITRYLHIIGASIVFGAGFHYLTTTEDLPERKRAMMQWIVAGMLIQFLVGGVLALTLQEWLSKWVLLPLTIGILSAIVLVWIIFSRISLANPFVGKAILLLPIVLAGMLLTRQFIQQQKVLPFLDKAKENARQYNELLSPYLDREPAVLVSQLQTVYNSGETIFSNSCSVCHGLTGRGDGPSGQRLIVPPENISQVRADEGFLRNVILTGVPGSGMPYFAVYDKYKIDDLLKYLNDRFQITALPGTLPVTLSELEQKEGVQYFSATCALCHGLDGRGSDYSRPFLPAPPDLTRYNLTPQREFQIITEGYPGTAMRSFGELPEKTRWALVQKVNSLRK